MSAISAIGGNSAATQVSATAKNAAPAAAAANPVDAYGDMDDVLDISSDARNKLAQQNS